MNHELSQFRICVCSPTNFNLIFVFYCFFKTVEVLQQKYDCDADGELDWTCNNDSHSTVIRKNDDWTHGGKWLLPWHCPWAKNIK
jgi:hypothetical protein